MSNQFWNKHLSHLANAKRPRASAGIAGKNGTTVYRVQLLETPPDAGKSTEAKLLKELEQQRRARRGD